MSLVIAYAGLLAGEFIYHRIRDEMARGGDATPRHAADIPIPLVAEGSAIPMYFGRVRVRSPILAATGSMGVFDTTAWGFNTLGVDATAYPLIYGLDMLFVLGIPFEDGVNRMHNMWAGDSLMLVGTLGGKTIEDATGDGNHEQPSAFTPPVGRAIDLSGGQGLVEFLNGNSSQQLVDALATTSYTFTADRLTDIDAIGSTPAANLPGLRGYACAFLFNGEPSPIGPEPDDYGAIVGDPPTADVHLRWALGPTPQVPAYSFEVSSYPETPLHSRTVASGDDANPADVAYAVWLDKMGKLGLAAARVDYETFRECAERLDSEGHGYSRCFEGLTSADDILLEIAQATDCVFYEDPFDGEIKMGLVRPEDPDDLDEINIHNCERIESMAAGGWTGIVNRVRVVYEDRDNEYRTDSVIADNQANAVGQDGETHEVVLQFPSIKTRTLARAVATRELSARSRPLAKLTAVCSNAFRDKVPGNKVLVSWPEYNIGRRIFTVASNDRGASDSNTCKLMLVEDFEYTHRFAISDGTGLPSFPEGAVE